jgi:hypothetical protein
MREGVPVTLRSTRACSTVHPATSGVEARARDYTRLDELVAELMYENRCNETPPGAERSITSSNAHSWK